MANTGLGGYALLGKSGLRVSPLCLGTMTFGTEWGWGAPEDAAHRMLDLYFDAGGNFVDTADGYTGGSSERIIGSWLRAKGGRDRMVLATKFTFGAAAGDPNAGGNARKNIYRALEGSLARLGTDYVDLYWLHAWDGLTPAEEVLATLDALVRAGKVRYIGFSDVPAWYAARAQTLAEWRGTERVAALQLEYSLAERNIEREHVPLALELGLGICPWSPLASGLLSGKYTRAALEREGGEGRLAALRNSGNPAFEKLYDPRNWPVVDALQRVAGTLGRPAAQVALNWVTRRPGVTSTIVGASRPEQLETNLAALDFALPAELSAELERAGRPEVVHPYTFFTPPMRAMITNGTVVRREPPWFRGE